MFKWFRTILSLGAPALTTTRLKFTVLKFQLATFTLHLSVSFDIHASNFRYFLRPFAPVFPPGLVW